MPRCRRRVRPRYAVRPADGTQNGTRRLYAERGTSGGWLFANTSDRSSRGHHERRPNARTIYRYLCFRGHDDGPETFLDGIERVGAGESMAFTRGGAERLLWSCLVDELEGTRVPRPRRTSTSRRPGWSGGLRDRRPEARTGGLAASARSGSGVGEFVYDGVNGLVIASDSQMASSSPPSPPIPHASRVCARGTSRTLRSRSGRGWPGSP